MKLLIDENLPRGFAVALDAVFASYGDQVIHINDKFGPGVKDEDWLPIIGREGGWSLLSNDIRIAKKKPTRELLRTHRLVGFFFAPSFDKKPVHIKLARILTKWNEMQAFSALVAGGTFEVTERGAKFNPIGR